MGKLIKTELIDRHLIFTTSNGEVYDGNVQLLIADSFVYLDTIVPENVVYRGKIHSVIHANIPAMAQEIMKQSKEQSFMYSDIIQSFGEIDIDNFADVYSAYMF